MRNAINVMMRSSILSRSHSLQPIMIVWSCRMSVICSTSAGGSATRTATASTIIVIVVAGITIRVMWVMILPVQIWSTVDWLKPVNWSHQWFTTDPTWWMSKIESTARQWSSDTCSAKPTCLWSFVNPKMHARNVCRSPVRIPHIRVRSTIATNGQSGPPNDKLLLFR